MNMVRTDIHTHKIININFKKYSRWIHGVDSKEPGKSLIQQTGEQDCWLQPY